MRSWFYKRDYPKTLLEKEMSKVKFLPEDPEEKIKMFRLF